MGRAGFWLFHKNRSYPIVKDQIVVFPDFDLAGRTKDETIYFDNVLFEGYIEQQISWNCINSTCQKQNDSFGQFTDSVTCATNCVQTDINNSQQSKRVIKIYDLLGIEVKNIRSKGVFFYLYVKFKQRSIFFIKMFFSIVRDRWLDKFVKFVK